jgi:hypothetical protein
VYHAVLTELASWERRACSPHRELPNASNS